MQIYDMERFEADQKIDSNSDEISVFWALAILLMSWVADVSLWVDLNILGNYQQIKDLLGPTGSGWTAQNLLKFVK